MIAREFQIYGKVQGVYFRASACEKAQELAVTGFVRNEEDGTVTVHAEGSQEALDELHAWCQMGPATADVQRVEIKQGTVEEFEKFEILGPSAESETTLEVHPPEDQEPSQSCC
jgi:acylphosphatase